MASTVKRVVLYNFAADFERIVVTLACSSREFYECIGVNLDPELMRLEASKLAMRAAHQIKGDGGYGPAKPIIVVQRLRRWMNEGKVPLEKINEVMQLFDDAEDAGLPDEDSVVAEVAPMLQERIRDDAVNMAIESYGKKGNLSKVVELEAKAQNLGKPRSRIGPRFVALSGVVSEPITWLWPRRIPLGKLTVLDGDPGLGKSSLLADLAARITTGRAMPGRDECGDPARVLILSAEDGAGDTIRPRIEVAGGDSTRAFVMAADEMTSLPSRLPVLTDWIESHRPKLVVIDPVMAFLDGSVDAHRDQDIRRVTTPLAGLAEQHGIAIVLVRHLNKAAGQKAINRGGGSMGLVGAARSGLLLARAPTDPDERILVGVKSNLGALARAIRFKLVASAVSGDRPFEAARIEWGDECDASADDLLSPPPKRENAVDKAKAFLLELLSEGPFEQTEVVRLAKEEGISERSLQRAKPDLAESHKEGHRWIWTLKNAKAANTWETGNLGGLREQSGLSSAANGVHGTS